nr:MULTISPECIES: restriction endonuclease [unclassified Streptomyces]
MPRRRYAQHIQTFNGTAPQEHGADVPVFVATCPFTEPGREFAAKDVLVLLELDRLGRWKHGITAVVVLR